MNNKNVIKILTATGLILILSLGLFYLGLYVGKKYPKKTESINDQSSKVTPTLTSTNTANPTSNATPNITSTVSLTPTTIKNSTYKRSGNINFEFEYPNIYTVKSDASSDINQPSSIGFYKNNSDVADLMLNIISDSYATELLDSDPSKYKTKEEAVATLITTNQCHQVDKLEKTTIGKYSVLFGQDLKKCSIAPDMSLTVFSFKANANYYVTISDSFNSKQNQDAAKTIISTFQMK